MQLGARFFKVIDTKLFCEIGKLCAIDRKQCKIKVTLHFVCCENTENYIGLEFRHSVVVKMLKHIFNNLVAFTGKYFLFTFSVLELFRFPWNLSKGKNGYQFMLNCIILFRKGTWLIFFKKSKHFSFYIIECSY